MSLPLEPTARGLAMPLDGLDEALGAIREDYEPHHVRGYLYSVA
ncbi:MAG: hypothetical protein ACRDOI_17135 [Trebonia sp.]